MLRDQPVSCQKEDRAGRSCASIEAYRPQGLLGLGHMCPLREESVLSGAKQTLLRNERTRHGSRNGETVAWGLTNSPQSTPTSTLPLKK